MSDKPEPGTPEQEEYAKAKFREVAARFVPYDPRFPNQNQTNNCKVNYVDYYRCLKKKDESYCAWYKNAYEHLCPNDWIEKWDEQRANGNIGARDCL